MNTPIHLLLNLLFVLLLIGSDSGCGGVPSEDPARAEGGTASNAGNGNAPAPAGDLFENADGVVQFADGIRGADRILTIYDEEGVPLKRIDRDDDSLDSLEGEEGDFFPLLFSNGAQRDFAIEMTALRKSRNWIEVVIHEAREPRSKGYVRADDPQFRFLEWPDWVLGHFNIRFDAENNPVLDAPEGRPKTVKLPDEPLIKPERVEGDWVRIRWVGHEPGEPSVRDIARSHPANEGWIRWRKGGKIEIGEYYP